MVASVFGDSNLKYNNRLKLDMSVFKFDRNVTGTTPCNMSMWMEWRDLELATILDGKEVVEDTEVIETMDWIGTRAFAPG